MKKISLAVCLCLLAASSVLGQDDVASGPYGVKLEAYIADKPPAGTKPSYVWTVGDDQDQNKVYTLQIVKHESMSETISMDDINENVEMFKPNFRLGGDFKAIAAFKAAKPDQKMSILATVRTDPADHRMELNTVMPAK